MRRLRRNSTPIDLYSVTKALRDSGDLSRVGGVKDLYALQEGVPTAVNVGFYCGIVREQATRRHLIDAGTSICERSRTPSLEVADVVEDAQRILYGVRKTATDVGFIAVAPTLGDVMSELEDTYHRRLAGEVKELGFPTGLAALDDLLTGLQRSDLVVIAGRPSMGKSAFVHNIALNIARDGETGVALSTLEMGRPQVVMRMLATLSGVDMQNMRKGDLTQAQWDRLAMGASLLETLQIWINDMPGVSANEIRSACRELKMRRPALGVVIVDYLQLLSVQDRRGQNREQQIAECSRTLKEMARELDVVVILLSQLNRQVEARDNKRAQLSDLRESGSIEQDADVVLFLYRDEYYRPDTTTTPGEVEIKVAKHRNGPTGTVTAHFRPSVLEFRAEGVGT